MCQQPLLAVSHPPPTRPRTACAAVSELTTLSGKALLPSFADDDGDQEELIAQTVQEVSALFKECEKRLKALTAAKSEGASDEARERRRPTRARKATPRGSTIFGCPCGGHPFGSFIILVLVERNPLLV